MTETRTWKEQLNEAKRFMKAYDDTLGAWPGHKPHSDAELDAEAPKIAELLAALKSERLEGEGGEG